MLKKGLPSNSPDTIKALVGDKIAGVICDTDGKWWIIAESGCALVVGASSSNKTDEGSVPFVTYHVEEPYHVKKLIEKHQEMLQTWENERSRLADIGNVIIKGR